MKSKTKFWLQMSILLALGAFFVGLALYSIGGYVLLYFASGVGADLSGQTRSTVIIGMGGLVLGSIFIGQSIRWIRDTKPKPRANLDSCPFCGAIIEGGALQCTKCGKGIPSESDSSSGKQPQAI